MAKRKAGIDAQKLPQEWADSMEAARKADLDRMMGEAWRTNKELLAAIEGMGEAYAYMKEEIHSRQEWSGEEQAAARTVMGNDAWREWIPTVEWRALRRERKKDQGLSDYQTEQTTERQKKVDLARELWADYAPRVKSKEIKNAVALKRIGEAMQKLLGLSNPIPAETVRSYLKEKVSGED